MAVDLEELSGEQLLLFSVLHAPDVQPAVDRELDRRSLTPPAPTQGRDRGPAALAATWPTQHAA